MGGLTRCVAAGANPAGHDGEPIEPGNSYVPLIDRIRFSGLRGGGGCTISCGGANGSACHGLTFSGPVGARCKCDHCVDAAPRPHYACKTTAAPQFGAPIRLPWGVCLPSDSPLNNAPDYPNWGPTHGDFETLEACRAHCTV